MIKKLPFIIFLFLLSCDQKFEQIERFSSLQGEVTWSRGESPLPKNITIDTLANFDSLRKTEISLIFPNSSHKGLKESVSLIRDSLLKRKENFLKEVDSYSKQELSLLEFTTPNSFSAEPISIYYNENILSCCFMVHHYLSGSAHPISEYYSFNYDLKRKKLIKFSDYFEIKTPNDSSNFIQKLNSAIDRENAMALELLYELDFHIISDSISFNFDDYEIASYAEGAIQAPLHKKELNSLVKKHYRHK